MVAANSWPDGSYANWAIDRSLYDGGNIPPSISHHSIWLAGGSPADLNEEAACGHALLWFSKAAVN